MEVRCGILACRGIAAVTIGIEFEGVVEFIIAPSLSPRAESRRRAGVFMTHLGACKRLRSAQRLRFAHPGEQRAMNPVKLSENLVARANVRYSACIRLGAQPFDRYAKLPGDEGDWD